MSRPGRKPGIKACITKPRALPWEVIEESEGVSEGGGERAREWASRGPHVAGPQRWLGIDNCLLQSAGPCETGRR